MDTVGTNKELVTPKVFDTKGPARCSVAVNPTTHAGPPGAVALQSSFEAPNP